MDDNNKSSKIIIISTPNGSDSNYFYDLFINDLNKADDIEYEKINWDGKYE